MTIGILYVVPWPSAVPELEGASATSVSDCSDGSPVAEISGGATVSSGSSGTRLGSMSSSSSVDSVPDNGASCAQIARGDRVGAARITQSPMTVAQQFRGWINFGKIDIIRETSLSTQRILVKELNEAAADTFEGDTEKADPWTTDFLTYAHRIKMRESLDAA